MSTNLRPVDNFLKSLKINTIRDQQAILDLRYGTWTPGTDRPKSYVVFANGRTEWIEKYAYLPESFGLSLDQGFVTWDHRGQGASGGARAHVEDYSRFAADAALIIDATTHGQPYIMVTHSMGGLIALVAIMSGLIKPKALVMCSPLLGLPNNPIPRVFARPAAKLLRTLGLGPVSSGAGTFETAPFANNILTNSPEMFARIKASPYKVPGPTFGWVDATFRAIDFCFDPDNLRSFMVPTIVMYGEDERVVDPDAFGRWVKVANEYAQTKIEIMSVPGARHELFSEVDLYYRQAVEVVQSWMQNHL